MTQKPINSDISITTVSPNDLHLLEQIEHLAREIWTEHYSPIIGINQVNYMLDKFQSKQVMKEQIEDGYIYATVQHAGSLIGYFSVQPRENTLFLSKVYLLKKVRGLGLFSQVLKEIERIAKVHHKPVVSLTVNKYNSTTIAVYEAKGFEIIEEAVFDIGNGYVMDDFVMQKQI